MKNITIAPPKAAVEHVGAYPHLDDVYKHAAHLNTTGARYDSKATPRTIVSTFCWLARGLGARCAPHRRPLQPPSLTPKTSCRFLPPCLLIPQWLRPRRHAKEQHFAQAPDMVRQ